MACKLTAGRGGAWGERTHGLGGPQCVAAGGWAVGGGGRGYGGKWMVMEKIQ